MNENIYRLLGRVATRVENLKAKQSKDDKDPKDKESKDKKKSKIAGDKVLTASDPLISDISLYIPTGSTLLDLACSHPYGRGIPATRIIDIFGEPSEGKSTLVSNMMINIQRMGGVAVLIDSEGRFDKPRNARMGMNLDDVIIIEANTLESAFDDIMIVAEEVRSDDAFEYVPVMVFWDPISNTPTIAELEKGRWGGGMAERARFIREALRKYTYALARYRIGIVFTEHTIATLGQYTSGTDTSGGKGIKFLSSLRMSVRKSGWFFASGKKDENEERKEPDGILCKIKTVKNSSADPYKSVIFPITRDGIDDAFSIFMYLADQGFVHQGGGGWYTIPWEGQEIKFQGAQKFYDVLHDNPDLLSFMKYKTAEYWDADNSIAVDDE